jgi:hypothetical protein
MGTSRAALSNGRLISAAPLGYEASRLLVFAYEASVPGTYPPRMHEAYESACRHLCQVHNLNCAEILGPNFRI